MDHYSCEGGVIITDGGSLINVRIDAAVLDPANSKCPGELEVCCRHPDWVGLPVNQPVSIHKPCIPDDNTNSNIEEYEDVQDLVEIIDIIDGLPDDQEVDPNCTAYADSGYQCVDYFNCEEGNIITDGSFNIDVRARHVRPKLPKNSSFLT